MPSAVRASRSYGLRPSRTRGDARPDAGGTPFAASRRLTSPRIPTSKSSIMATVPRPPLQQYHPIVTRRERNDRGPNSALFDCDVPRNFTKILGSAYVLAVNRKYDDCHGVPRPPRRNLRARCVRRTRHFESLRI